MLNRKEEQWFNQGEGKKSFNLIRFNQIILLYGIPRACALLDYHVSHLFFRKKVYSLIKIIVEVFRLSDVCTVWSD